MRYKLKIQYKPKLQRIGFPSLNERKRIIPKSFFCRPAKEVAPDLIGCVLVKRELNGELLSGVIVETEAYSQEEPGCHGFRKKTKKNQTLFGDPGNLYVYLTYGIYYCVNIVTEKSNWASGVLLRALSIPGEPERIASGPGLLARRFDLNITHDNQPLTIENGLWLIEKSRSFQNMSKIIQTTRIGISEGQDIAWRWYLQPSRSISKRIKGDKNPSISQAWIPKQRTNT